MRGFVQQRVGQSYNSGSRKVDTTITREEEKESFQRWQVKEKEWKLKVCRRSEVVEKSDLLRHKNQKCLPHETRLLCTMDLIQRKWLLIRWVSICDADMWIQGRRGKCVYVAPLSSHLLDWSFSAPCLMYLCRSGVVVDCQANGYSFYGQVN